MKIAIYHNLGSGGAKKALFHIVKGLNSKGHTIHVYTTSLANHQFYDLRPYADLYHIEQVPSAAEASGFEPFATLRTIRAVRLTERKIAKRINAGGYSAAFVTNCRILQHPQLLRLLTIPVVLYSQEILRSYYDRALLDRLRNDYNPPKRRLLTPLGALIANWLAWYRATLDAKAIRAIPEEQVLVNSNFSRNCFIKAYRLSPRVCYLGTEQNEGSPTDFSARKNIVLSVGGFEAHKGHDWVIRTIGRIDPAIRPGLVIIGDRGSDNYLAALRQLATDHRVQLETQRSISDEAVISFYRTARLTVCAQWAEPFGFAPIESQVQGTPVVAVREGGLQETVIDGVGGITCDRNTDELAAAMTRLLKDHKLWQSLSSQGAIFVTKKFSWKNTVNTIESTLKQLKI